MKSLFKTLILFFALAGSAASAAPFSIEDLHKATKLSTDALQVSNPEHAAHFVGYKSWLSGDDAKVKIYVTHEGADMDFTYLCHKHDEEIECHLQ